MRNRLGIVAAVAVVSDLRKRGCAEWPEYILAKSASTLVAPEPPRARPLPLTCSGIRKRYRESRADFQLECAHLAIPPRTVLGLVGANGTGKSTLLRILAGRSTADAGEIHYPHWSGAVSWLRGDVDWGAIRDRIFYIEQERELLSGRLDQELHLFAQTQGYRGDMNRCIVDLVLEQTELASYRKMRWSQLSGGYRLRAVLAKLLISRATLVVLDEPLAPLDVDAQRDVLDYLKESTVYADEPRCTILSSQHIPEIESIADQMMMTDPSGLVQPIDVSQGACVEIGAAPEALSGNFIESVRQLGIVFEVIRFLAILAILVLVAIVLLRIQDKIEQDFSGFNPRPRRTLLILCGPECQRVRTLFLDSEAQDDVPQPFPLPRIEAHGPSPSIYARSVFVIIWVSGADCGGRGKLGVFRKRELFNAGKPNQPLFLALCLGPWAERFAQTLICSQPGLVAVTLAAVWMLPQALAAKLEGFLRRVTCDFGRRIVFDVNLEDFGGKAIGKLGSRARRFDLAPWRRGRRLRLAR